MNDEVTVTVRLHGVCPAGHPVYCDLPYTVARGDSGVVSGDAPCPEHQHVIRLGGTFDA